MGRTREERVDKEEVDWGGGGACGQRTIDLGYKIQ